MADQRQDHDRNGPIESAPDHADAEPLNDAELPAHSDEFMRALDRVCAKFTATISPEKAELLARLLGGSDSGQGAA